MITRDELRQTMMVCISTLQMMKGQMPTPQELFHALGEAYREVLTEYLMTNRYQLCSAATAWPNDHPEKSKRWRYPWRMAPSFYYCEHAWDCFCGNHRTVSGNKRVYLSSKKYLCSEASEKFTSYNPLWYNKTGKQSLYRCGALWNTISQIKNKQVLSPYGGEQATG